MDITISALKSAYQSGSCSPVEVVEDLLHKIADSTLNAFITVLADQALSDAIAARQRLQQGMPMRALEGIPVAVKDLIDVAGCRCTMGSEQYANHIAQSDAQVVRLLREQGAIVLGKTNTHEFAYGSTGDRSFFGPVRNPVDNNLMPGGSSSGSAAAVGAGLAPVALGTDTSASIRLPAALCGVVGMKPTRDLVSRQGVFPLSRTLDHVGPISQTVKDNAILLEAMAGKSVGHYSGKVGQDVSGMVIGVPKHFYRDYLSVAVETSLLKAAELLQSAGAIVKEVEIDGIYGIYDAQQLVLRTEAYAVHEESLSNGAPYIAEVRNRLMTGQGVLASEYLRNLDVMSQAIASFDTQFKEVDVLLTATCGITAPPLDERQTTLNGKEYLTPWLLTRLTAPTNFSGHPSLSVPFGKDEKGLPIGLQLIGRFHDEVTLYQLGSFLECH